MPYYGSRRHSSWGDLYGIDPASLTMTQLNQVKFNKLVELLETDPRVANIVAQRFVDSSLENINDGIRKISKEIAEHSSLKQAYNKFVAERSDEINRYCRDHYSARDYFVFWNALNDANKVREIETTYLNRGVYLRGETVPYELDFEWLYNQGTELYTKVITQIMKWGGKHQSHLIAHLNYNTLYSEFPELGTQIINHGFNRGGRTLECIVTKMPDEVYQATLPKFFLKENKKHSKYTLARSDTPEKYIMLALREIAGKHSLPAVRVKITTAMLEKLPPITRMKAIHSIMFSSTIGSAGGVFVDLTEDKLKNLLFTSTIRYNDNVVSIMNYFNRMKKDE